ncbi:MAG: hypothetical protein K2X98_02455 [Alphaproteobacteria bacterium]|nr:hypothetical protein [Alphaproteobacteria bacterium]
MHFKNILLAGVFGSFLGIFCSTNALGMDEEFEKSTKKRGLVLSKPTQGLVLSKPTQGLVLSKPTQGLVLSKPTQGLVLSKPTQGLVLSKPTQGLVLSPTVTTPQLSITLSNAYIEPFVGPGQGVRSQMIDQDTTVTGLGWRPVYVPHGILTTGLGDREFTLVNPVRVPDYSRTTLTADQRRAISIWTTSRLGADVLRQDYVDMIRLTSGKQSYNQALVTFYKNWKKGLPPIMIYQNDGVDENAYYSRTDTTREAHFFHFTSEVDKKTTIFTGESSDIVGHEIWGHGHLDEMCPWFFDSNSLELGGFHEGHADSMNLTIGLAISANQRQTLLAQTGGDLHVKGNFLGRLGEQFGAGIGSDSVRNLDVDAIVGQVDQEVHDLGRIWASGTYDILADAYPAAQKALISRMSEEQILLHTSAYLRRLENLSILLQESKEPGFTNFASTMNMLAQENVALTGIAEIDTLPWEDYIKNQYTRRKVPVNGGSGKAQLFNINFSNEKVNLCGTVHSHLKKMGH